MFNFFPKTKQLLFWEKIFDGMFFPLCVFRLSDNYVRFYLKVLGPQYDKRVVGYFSLA